MAHTLNVVILLIVTFISKQKHKAKMLLDRTFVYKC